MRSPSSFDFKGASRVPEPFFCSRFRWKCSLTGKGSWLAACKGLLRVT